MVCLALLALTVAAFWPVTGADFVNIDDPTYVSDNVRVQRGLSGENVRWAFTTFHFSNWHPLTWLSYMVDCELFGPNPKAMHAVNLGLHTINAMLLFLVLKRMTGGLWASAMVAALFALHPLHVESVAWISERKDVLSTLFWILTMWAYAEYVRRKCAGWYAAALVFFAIGLMSKAMLVTLPCVLLLLDAWPLRRVDVRAPRWLAAVPGLCLDKLPFLALAAVSSYLTFQAQRAEAVVSFVRLPLFERTENAIVSYGRYLAKTFWPTDLAVFYPHPVDWSGFEAGGALLLLVALSAAAILLLRHTPYFFVGWFWFVGTLVPVIGLVQVGGQSMADRYTYVPSIGLFIAIVWGLRDFLLARRLPLSIAFAAGTAVIAICATLTHRQAGHWANSLKLFSHAERVTPPNTLVLNNLGDALLSNGQTNKATAKFKAALELDPEDSWAWGNVGNALFREGKLDQALEHYRTGLSYKPGSAELTYNIGLVHAARGELNAAIEHYHKAIALNPMYLIARLNLGNSYIAIGNADAAATNYVAIIGLKPSYAPAHYNLGNTRLIQERFEEAVQCFSEALRFDPAFADAHRQLAVALQSTGRQTEAVQHFERALALRPGDVGARAQLAALLGHLGQTEASLMHYREALKLDPRAATVMNNLAWTLATHPNANFRNGPEAVTLAERAVETTQRRTALFLGTLAAAYAEAGRFEDAQKAAEEAIKLAEETGQTGLAAKNRELLAAYRQHRPWREPAGK